MKSHLSILKNTSYCEKLFDQVSSLLKEYIIYTET